MTKWDAFKKIKKSSPTHSQNILPSQYFISMDIHIWPTYLKSFCPNFFFWKSMAQKYPTYLQFDICQNFRSFFFWDPSLSPINFKDIIWSQAHFLLSQEYIETV